MATPQMQSIVMLPVCLVPGPGIWSATISSPTSLNSKSGEASQKVGDRPKVPFPRRERPRVPHDEDVANVGPMWKTRLCMYHANGGCPKPAKACSFAHGVADLRPQPDFERTSICPTMLKLGICDSPSCRYAHKQEELRVAPGLLKSRLCSFFLNGSCKVGESCRFAHTVDELRDAAQVLRDACNTPGTHRSTKRDQRRKGLPNQSTMLASQTHHNLRLQRRYAFMNNGSVPESLTEASTQPSSDEHSPADNTCHQVSIETRVKLSLSESIRSMGSPSELVQVDNTDADAHVVVNSTPDVTHNPLLSERSEDDSYMDSYDLISNMRNESFEDDASQEGFHLILVNKNTFLTEAYRREPNGSMQRSRSA